LRERILRGNVHGFKQRYMLTMYTFGAECKRDGTTSGVWIASPLYVFNPAHLAQYTNDKDIEWLNSFKGQGVSVFVENIRGTIRMAGINAPFITSGDGQAATNSQSTLIGMTGSGLERLAPVIQGQVDIAQTTAKLTSWEKDAQNAGFDWQGKQQPKTVGATPITADAWAPVEGMADRNFVEYTTTACTRAIYDSTTTSTADSNPQVGNIMQPFIGSNAQGDICGWDIDMNECALALAPIKANGVAGGLKVGINADVLAQMQTANGAAAISVNAATTSDQSITKNFYMSHHNVYRVGATTPTHQELPPKEYIQLVPPPTTNPTLIQDLYIQCVLDVEMDVRMEQDRLTLNRTQNASHSYLPKTRFGGDSQCHYNGAFASTGS
jgi:hypothetical protein